MEENSWFSSKQRFFFFFFFQFSIATSQKIKQKQPQKTKTHLKEKTNTQTKTQKTPTKQKKVTKKYHKNKMKSNPKITKLTANPYHKPIHFVNILFCFFFPWSQNLIPEIAFQFDPGCIQSHAFFRWFTSSVRLLNSKSSSHCNWSKSCFVLKKWNGHLEDRGIIFLVIFI